MSLKDQLFTYSNTFITLNELEKMDTDFTTYEELANEIIALENEGVLSRVKNAGINGKKPSISYKYRIQKGKLRKDIQQEIERMGLILHPSMQLDDYFRLPPQEWESDKPFIVKINLYLQENGFPDDEVPAPERSLALVGDEKWIQEKNGQRILEHLHIWDQLKVVPVHDPFSFAVNPSQFNNHYHLHLIVENKTTFDGLVGNITHTSFTSLIYGQGYKIVKSIEHFSRQLPFREAHHIIYYFGDLDWEGIKIWDLLSHKVEVIPATPFYLACLLKIAIPINKKQSQSEEALNRFLPYFDNEAQKQIIATLTKRNFFPQEVLSSKELKQIWSEIDWTNHSLK